MRRHEITDDHWGRVKTILVGQPSNSGMTAKDNRLLVNAVVWIVKIGAPWRDLSERFGRWDSVWKLLDCFDAHGVWNRVFEALQARDLGWMIIDSTVVRAHQRAAGESL
jgi:transposase